MNLPEESIVAVFRQIRAINDWDTAWTWLAQSFLGEARRESGAGRESAAALARQRAALCYHSAKFLAFHDDKKRRALTSSATTIFAQAVPALMPMVSRVEPAWRSTTLPAYLARPGGGLPAPLVVLLNSSDTAKEETLLWAGPFLQRGLAVLALDWPGTGEAALSTRLTADCDDLTDGVLALARQDSLLDDSNVAVVGIGLGGALAIRAAASDRRIAAAIAITPPYDAERWLNRASPLLLEHLTGAADGPEALTELVHGFALPAVVSRVRCPTLVLGAGRDLLVPPAESLRLCSEAGELGTLIWFADGTHGLYNAVEDWTVDVAAWLGVILNVAARRSSTGVDGDAAARTTVEMAAIGRESRPLHESLPV
jgi:dienelactone hydrolase